MSEEHKRIGFLVEELENKDWAVREDAAELLAEVGDPRAVEPLIKALEDEDWHEIPFYPGIQTLQTASSASESGPLDPSNESLSLVSH